MLTPGKLYRTLDEFYVSHDKIEPRRTMRLVFKNGNVNSSFRVLPPVLPLGSLVFFLGYDKMRVLKVLIGEEIKYIAPNDLYPLENLLFPVDLPKANPMIKRFSERIRSTKLTPSSSSIRVYDFPEPDF
jgi:hypothetical protein